MSHESPLVSIVLPTHNRPHRVGGALASILAQTYRHIEVIVVDDGSTVPVEGVIANIMKGDQRVRVVRHATSLGVSNARNSGIDATHGPLVAFLDDDDRWEPTKIALQVAYLANHLQVGMVSCHHLIEIEGSAGEPTLFRGPEEFSASQLLWANFFSSASLVMMRRQLLGNQFYFDPSLNVGEDWDLWLRCMRVDAAAVIPKPLVRYVAHHDARLTSTDNLRQELEAFLAKHGADMSPACRAFHLAHTRMNTGTGWAKRAHVFAALLAPSAATSILVREQFAHGLARLRNDPGLTERSLVRLIPTA